jgi:hypothetical protein
MFELDSLILSHPLFFAEEMTEVREVNWMTYGPRICSGLAGSRHEV